MQTLLNAAVVRTLDEIRIFYSWQSDRSDDVCRRFARIALEDAIAAIQPTIPAAIVLDSDTAGIAGTPPVSKTILRKIRNCDVFVGDVSFVATTAGGKSVPNPNVLTEYGYARALLDDERVVLVMNEAFGPPTALPFDLAHLRHPAGWNLPEAASAADRRRLRAAFGKRMQLVLAASIAHVLATRKSGSLDADAVAGAAARIADLRMRTGRGDAPALVTGPRLSVVMAPAGCPPYVDPARVKATRRDFVPDGYERAEGGSGPGQWASHDPPVRRGDAPNPEARWFTRLLASGVIETVIAIGVLEHEDADLALFELMATDPEFFVSILKDVYVEDGADPGEQETTEDERLRGNASHRILIAFERMPGAAAGAVDDAALTAWVDGMIEEGRKARRSTVVPMYVGRVIAHAPEEDGGWPPDPVARMIERLASDDVERSIMIERFNMRGVSIKAMFDGGNDERDLAALNRRWAKARVAFPRTKAMLNCIAGRWEEDAKRADDEAERDRLRFEG